jgi:hypothetical protein
VGVGLHLRSHSMLAVNEGTAEVDGQGWVRCTQHDPLGCNWLVPTEYEAAARGRCLADSLIRREPDLDDTIAREKLVPTALALRRLVYQLADIGLGSFSPRSSSVPCCRCPAMSSGAVPY